MEKMERRGVYLQKRGVCLRPVQTKGGRLHQVFDLAASRSKLAPLWRAGLPRVGVRSAPNQGERDVPDTALSKVLGLLRSPTQDKPARHRNVTV
ncbi:hypothetical protein TU75_00895 [Pseudomonas poae]|nr:hypothetical protein TU75_00895 [Pseudomonas poae]